MQRMQDRPEYGADRRGGERIRDEVPRSGPERRADAGTAQAIRTRGSADRARNRPGGAIHGPSE